jgi:hypothetical protein
MIRFLLFGLLLLFTLSASWPAQADLIVEDADNSFPEVMKCRGVSVVGPPDSVNGMWVESVKKMNADYVAIQPYGYSFNGKPEVHYNSNRQWWGERVNGSRTMVRQAHAAGVNVMLKPMVYIPGSWPGDYDLSTEAQWLIWEEAYRKYILEFAAMAESERAEMFVIGTEYKIAVEKRIPFWKSLLKEVRQVYSGKVTFAANWDSYSVVTFWNEFDFIGIDAYFPLVDSEIPSVISLRAAWTVHVKALGELNRRFGKPILFTEFGYRSLGKTAWKNWELDHISTGAGARMEGQENAYRAFFESVWNEPWFEGCFIWQWYTDHNHAGGLWDSDFTPQNKPAEEVIRNWFGKI